MTPYVIHREVEWCVTHECLADPICPGVLRLKHPVMCKLIRAYMTVEEIPPDE